MATALTEASLDGVPFFAGGKVHDCLETLDWYKTTPEPELPDEIVEKTLDKYRHVRNRLFG